MASTQVEENKKDPLDVRAMGIRGVGYWMKEDRSKYVGSRMVDRCGQ